MNLFVLSGHGSESFAAFLNGVILQQKKQRSSQGWIQGWKTDGVIIDAGAASMLRGRLRE